MDGSEAVTSEGERVGHHTETVLSDIEGELARVRPLGSGVGDDHLGEGGTVHDGAVTLLIFVEVLDGVEDDTLAVLWK